MRYDVFISHASEDKPEVVRPLFERLTAMGVKVWLDEHELTLGDSLRRNIDLGLTQSSFGIVILSHAFFAKEWPQKELDALVAREDGREKVILPVWHNLTVNHIKAYSPLLADKVAAKTGRGIDFVVEQIMQALSVEAKRRQLASTPHEIAVSTAQLKQDLTFDATESDGDFTPVGKLLIDALDRVQENADNNIGEITGVRTGLTDFDSLTLGLHKGEVTLLGARPLVGKTSMALTIACSVAGGEGLPVAIIAANYSEAQFANRLIGVAGSIPTQQIETGALSDDEWGRLSEVIAHLGYTNLFFIEQADLTTGDAAAKAKTLAKQFGGTLGLVVFDINQTINPSSGISREHAIEGAFQAIKRLAYDLACPVVVTTSLSSAMEMRPDRTPMLLDIPDIDLIERHLDNVVFLRRYTSLSDRNRAVNEIIVARQRRGPVGSVEIDFDRATGLFFDYLVPDDL